MREWSTVAMCSASEATCAITTMDQTPLDNEHGRSRSRTFKPPLGRNWNESSDMAGWTPMNASRLRDNLHIYKTSITLPTLLLRRQASLNKKLILLPNQAHGGGYGPQTLEFQYDQLSPGTMSNSGSYGVTSATVLLVSTPFQQCLDQHP